MALTGEVGCLGDDFEEAFLSLLFWLAPNFHKDGFAPALDAE